MDFLSRHYEKLILGLSLICFVWSMFFIQKREHESMAALRQTKDSLNTKVIASGYISELDENGLKDADELLASGDTRTRFDVNVSNYAARWGVEAASIDNNQLVKQEATGWSESTLFDPPRYVICKNTDCFTIIPFDGKQNSLVCPKCGTEQEAAAPEPTMADDLDGDGIPDCIEQDYAFLDYRYAGDAYEDYDGDGFSNLEEYQAGTDMERYEDMPALGYLLRTASKPYNKKIPFKLERVKKNASEDPRDWSAVMSDKKEYKAGQEIGRFKGYSVLAVNENSVTIMTPNGERHDMGKNREVTEQALAVRLNFLRSRFSNAVVEGVPMGAQGGPGMMGPGAGAGMNPAAGNQMVEARVGEEFTLSVKLSNGPANGMGPGRGMTAETMGMPPVVASTDREINEYYRVVSAENLKGENGRPEIKVYIEKLTGPGGVRDELIEVKAFDRLKDGMFTQNGNPMMGGMR